MEAGIVAQTLLSDVASQAKAALSRSRIFDLRRLAVEQDGDYVVLRGRVDSFYHKQLAQELVRAAVEGVEVLNAISVVYHRDREMANVDWRW
jgi:osmotically-inducible protein OsmY